MVWQLYRATARKDCECDFCETLVLLLCKLYKIKIDTVAPRDSASACSAWTVIAHAW